MSPRDGEDSVSSIVGTILMLAVTVTVFGGLSIVVLNEIRSTQSPPQAELAFVADGDRAVLTHRGGEPVALEGGSLLLNVGGSEIRYDLTAVADQTADGRFWRIGETLCLSGPDPPDPARSCLLAGQPILGVAVVAGGGLLADEGERGGDAGPCPLDNVAPTADSPWTFSVDVMTTTTGSVTAGFTVSDDCSGPDDTVKPSVSYRIQDGSSPPFTAITATSVTNTGPGAWEAIVPAQSWNLLGGQSLQLQASGLQDLRGNAGGTTATASEPIDAVTLVRYVTAATADAGSVGALGPAQDDADGDAATTMDEGGTSTPAGTGGPAKSSGVAQVATGTPAPTGAANVLASDDAAAEFTASGQSVEVSGFDLPSNAATVTAVSIGFEGRRDSQGGGTSPALRIDYKLGSGAYDNAPAATTVSATADTDHVRVLSGTFSVADVEAMTVRLTYAADTNRNPFVDHVFATITYTTSAQTTYSLDVRLHFTGTADGASETLDLRYQTDGDDTFEVQVWDATLNAGAGGYTVAGTLASTSFATFTHTLAPGEYNAGSPRIRIVDQTPTGTAAGALHVDYARVVTV